MLIAGLAGLAVAAGLVVGAGGAWLFAREQAVNELSRIRARAYNEVRYWQSEAERAKNQTPVTRACPCQHPSAPPRS